MIHDYDWIGAALALVLVLIFVQPLNVVRLARGLGRAMGWCEGVRVTPEWSRTWRPHGGAFLGLQWHRGISLVDFPVKGREERWTLFRLRIGLVCWTLTIRVESPRKIVEITGR